MNARRSQRSNETKNIFFPTFLDSQENSEKTEEKI